MGEDEAKDLLHLGVPPVAVRLLLGGAGAHHVPVHVDQQLLAQGVRHPGGAEALVPLGLLQLLDAVHVMHPPLRVEPQQMKPPLPGQDKAALQLLTGVTALLQPLLSQPDHHPLIGLRRVHNGSVNQIPAHQQQIPGLKEVCDPLHHIGNPAAQQQHQLVKGMVMVVHLRGLAVLQVEQAEVLLQVPPLVDALPVHWPRPLSVPGRSYHIPPIFTTAAAKRPCDLAGQSRNPRLCFPPGFAIL